VNRRPKTRTHPWVNESEILNNKLNKIGNIKAIKEFYWNRDVKSSTMITNLMQVLLKLKKSLPNIIQNFGHAVK